MNEAVRASENAKTSCRTVPVAPARAIFCAIAGTIACAIALVCAGALPGLGAAFMHHLGMYAMHFPGYIVWSLFLVALSLPIAVLAASAAAKGAAAAIAMPCTAMAAADFVCISRIQRYARPAGFAVTVAKGLATLTDLSMRQRCQARQALRGV